MRITWHPNVPGGLQAVTFTATFAGQPASLSVNPLSPLPVAQLTAIEVLPTNLLYALPPAGGTSDLYHATGIYSDQTAVNLDTAVAWSLVSTAGGTPIPSNQAGFREGRVAAWNPVFLDEVCHVILKTPDTLSVLGDLDFPRLSTGVVGSSALHIPRRNANDRYIRLLPQDGSTTTHRPTSVQATLLRN